MKKIPLNNDWHYTPKFKETFIKEGLKTYQTVQIPHTNIELPYHYFDETMYQFTSSYEKTLLIDPAQNKRYFLSFEGVMTEATIYFNHQKLTTHKGGYTPFTVEITDVIKQSENHLFVKVDSTERPDIPPFGFVVDYLTYGGIYREVALIEQPQMFIEDVFVTVDGNTIALDITMNGDTLEATPYTFVIKQNDEIVERFSDTLPQSKTIHKDIQLKYWDIDDPIVYTLEILKSKTVLYQTSFAKRDIAFKTDGFYLNGERLKLRGLNRHQSFPYVGYAMPSNMQKKDADILKYNLGCNVVRSSHYPPSRHFLNRCDEIGLLVITELPGWQHIGNTAWQEVALLNLEEMIIRDRNHPSIILWGVRINESPDNELFYTKTNQLAKQLDPTRPRGGVRNFKNSQFLEDVYTYNDFVHRGDNVGLEKRNHVTKQKVPYLVTEYNGHMYPTKPFDDEIHRINHAKRHLEVLNAMYQNNDIIGAIGWSMFDYNTHKDFGSGDKICYHGVLDMFRNEKYAASVYQSQTDNRAILEVVSHLQIGDFAASEIKEVLVLTNLEYIKFYINDDYINTFYPSITYQYLPHPPVIIDDFIGNLIHEKESFTHKDANRIKEILLYIMKHGMNLPLKLKLKMGWVLFKNKLSIDEAAKLYEKYVGKWGLESLTYRFEGYRNNQLVLHKEVGPTKDNDLNVTVADATIQESDTYEVTSVTISHEDSHHNRLFYSNEIITITIDGPLECIGPSTRPLRGGVTSFNLKTLGKSGLAKITITSHRFKNKSVTITVL